MTTSLRNFPSELEDALYSLATADHAPTATDLDDLARQYPEHAEDLIEIVVELAAEALVSSDTDFVAIEEKTSPAVSRAMSRFNNRLHEVTNAGTASEKKIANNIFASFDRDGIQSLATGMNASVLFIIKLRDRVIAPETISLGFKRKLAEEVQAPLEAVIAHLAGPRVVQASAFFKADQKPQAVGQQTFEEAVQQSGLTDEQRTYLLSL
jgi:hypothetical protein